MAIEPIRTATASSAADAARAMANQASQKESDARESEASQTTRAKSPGEMLEVSGAILDEMA